MLLYPDLRQIFSAVFLFLLIAGCSTQPVKEELPAGEIEIARQFYDAGDYTAAAEEFLKLANAAPATLEDDSPSLQKQAYQLTAAEAYLLAGESLSARKITALIDRNLLDTPLTIRHDLITAKIAELDQQPDKVIEALRLTPVSEADPEIQRNILEMRITAYETLKSPIEAARSRALLDPLLESETDRVDNRRAIWSSINQLEPESILEIQDNPQDPLSGWAELATITRENLFNTNAFTEKINEWRLRYPDHPAEHPILSELFEKSEILGKKVSAIALLLPQNGRYAQAGAAVRDGFLSAWYSDNDQPDQPMVHVYDANENNILDVYNRAIAEGADLVVGPLEKNAIKALLTLPELPVRTLALNQLDEPELDMFSDHIDTDRFYQFGLPPEQEAEQVAEKAWSQGYTHALAITPNGAWGDRLFNAFKNKYEELGGTLLEHQIFDTSKPDYSTTVSQLLNIDGSEQRYNELTRVVNRKIKFEPRARQDMDVIFMAALPVQARQIRPQLLFYRASQTPVMTTSHAFGLPPRGEPDLDMEGVILGDMPWMIEHQAIDPETPLSMQQNWPEDNAAFRRLYALGIDAYKIIPQLGRLRLQAGGKFRGVTGDLFMNEHGQIQRELAWAKFVRGKLQRIDIQQNPLIIPGETQKSPDQ